MIPRPVCGDARQFVTYFGGGSNHSIMMAESRAEDSAWDPSSARPPSQPAKTREESACLSFAPPVVHMTQFGIAHTHRLAHGPIHSRRYAHRVGSKSLRHARARTQAHPDRQILRVSSLSESCASPSARPPVSARLSVGAAPLLGGFTDVGRRGSQMFLRWFHQSAPSLFIVSTLWQTNTLTCPGS